MARPGSLHGTSKRKTPNRRRWKQSRTPTWRLPSTWMKSLKRVLRAFNSLSSCYTAATSTVWRFGQEQTARNVKKRLSCWRITRRTAGRLTGGRWRNRGRWATGPDWRAASNSNSCECWGTWGAVLSSFQWRCRCVCSSAIVGSRLQSTEHCGTSGTTLGCQVFYSNEFIHANESAVFTWAPKQVSGAGIPAAECKFPALRPHRAGCPCNIADRHANLRADRHPTGNRFRHRWAS